VQGTHDRLTEYSPAAHAQPMAYMQLPKKHCPPSEQSLSLMHPWCHNSHWPILLHPEFLQNMLSHLFTHLPLIVHDSPMPPSQLWDQQVYLPEKGSHCQSMQLLPRPQSKCPEQAWAALPRTRRKITAPKIDTKRLMPPRILRVCCTYGFLWICGRIYAACFMTC